MSSGPGSSGRESDAVSAHTALLRSQFLRQQEEYRGDDVRPFWVDPLAPYASRRPPSELTDDDAAAAKADAELPIPASLKKQRCLNWVGSLAAVFFLFAFVFYVAVRSMHTLDLGPQLWYGVLVLVVEIIGGLAMLPYAACLLLRVAQPLPSGGAAPHGTSGAPPPGCAMSYHVRVVIPCYREPLEVVAKTVMASLYAVLPPGCQRTVYLLDDGRDPDKRKYVHSLNVVNAVYVSGRKRARGEMNGKSANINSAMRQIYPPGVAIPLNEVICVFDADQVPNADFFTKTVPLLDGGRDVAMVLSPQAFYNLNPGGDIFNHANVHFWDYTQPGYDALGLISCTGTNFLLRSRAFSEAGWFPEWTLTEDFALGIELKRAGWQCRYVDEYLAIGEAPEEVRNCFQQRSRWAKGHFQVFFSGHNPVFKRGLSPLMRWLYGSVLLSYFSSFLATPLLLIVPVVTVWFGAFPIVINLWAAIAITVYYAASTLLMYYTRTPSHLKSMWFAGVSTSILWFAFLKAMYRATLGKWLSGTIVFKVTAKGLQRIKDLPFRDVWPAAVSLLIMLPSFIFGTVHLFKSGVIDTPLAISLIYMLYNMIPPLLLLLYAVYSKRGFFNAVCKLAMLASAGLALFGIILVWLMYPKAYDYQSTLSSSVAFYDTQRVGQPVGAASEIRWRSGAFRQDGNATVYLASSLGNDTASGGDFGGDPFAGFGDSFGDPFAGRRRLQQAADPFADPGTGPAAGSTPAEPGGEPAGAPPAESGDPFAGGSPPSEAGPFASDASYGGGGGNSFDPFSGDGGSAGEGEGEGGSALADGAWDLGGGFISGMAGGEIKATTPIAFSTAVLSWGLAAFPDAFDGAGAEPGLGDRLRATIRWGSDYLLKTYRSFPDRNETYLITRVGDIDTESLVWYRPEDGTAPRPAYAVDLSTGGADLAGSVAAGLAASAVVHQSAGDAEYAQRLVAAATEVYGFGKAAKAKFTDGDFNATLLYNSSTFYDDLAWAAAWLYRATREASYLEEMYDFYVQHLQTEADVADWKYAFDWDNVFWPLNVLMAQETGKGTFKKQSEAFLKNWICAGNAANYTARGRAFNPMSGSLGATANAAMLAMMYGDLVESAAPDAARTYRCWGLSQVRYMMGDAGRSLVVCNRVTGLLSPDPDTHELTGALVYGSGFNDGFSDVRSMDSAWVGIENNAGFTGALAGASLLPKGQWEVCLQQYGIYRNDPVCGSFINI